MSAASPRPVRLVFAPAPDDAQVSALAAALSVPRALAALLVQRGFGDVEAARRFLRPGARPAGRPAIALGGHGRRPSAPSPGRCAPAGTILVHGDYDVDGQCATALLTRALRHRRGQRRAVRAAPHARRLRLPRRPGSPRAREVGGRLILTCDCGITAVETVRAARAAGIRGRRDRPSPPGPRASRPPPRSWIRSAPATTRRTCDALRHRHRLQAGAGAGAGARPAAQPPAPPARLRGARHGGRRGAAAWARTGSWCSTGSSCSAGAGGPASGR